MFYLPPGGCRIPLRLRLTLERAQAAHMLESFFLDPDRGTVPRLSRAQAIPADPEVRRNIAIKEPYLWL